jgi:hypothetical protein
MLRKEYLHPFLFILHEKIRMFAMMQNKQRKPVLFASMRINIRFIFAYICFQPNIRCTVDHKALVPVLVLQVYGKATLV